MRSVLARGILALIPLIFLTGAAGQTGAPSGPQSASSPSNLAGPSGSYGKHPVALAATPPADQGPTGGFKLKVDVNLVLVEATVREPNGGIAGDLGRQDFHVFEDGVEQEIRYFSRDELPLAVGLVVDRSGSMAPAVRELRGAAYAALARLKPSDQVALFAFQARPERLDGLTSDRRRIADDVAAIRTAGATVISDALFEAAQYLARTAPQRRHALILISDNENTLKGYTGDREVIREALETQTVIYSVRIGAGLQARYHGWPVELPLYRDVSVPRITSETGGEVIEAPNAKALDSAMETVIERLKQRYTLGYQSANHRLDGGFRRIEVRVGAASPATAATYTVYARRGYYAPAERTAWRENP